ncbi:hypothetical protein CR513_14012, partial [Mucuna pruriens]
MALSEYDIVYTSQNAIKGRALELTGKWDRSSTGNPIRLVFSLLDKVFGDSALAIYHLRGEWETRDAKLIPYHAYIIVLVEKFEEISFHYVLRDENQMVDALTTLSAMLQAN